MWRGALGLDQPGDAMNEHAGLPAPGAGQHQGRTQRRGYGGTLGVVQGCEDRGNVGRIEAHGRGEFYPAPSRPGALNRRHYQ